MALTRVYSNQFERLWAVYPKWPSSRSKKELAYKSYQAADKILRFDDADIEAIRDNIEERLRFCETWQRGNKFGPVGMQVYLNQHLWNEPYPRFKSPVRESSAPPVDLWVRMGYASEADYYAGRRMNH